MVIMAIGHQPAPDTHQHHQLGVKFRRIEPIFCEPFCEEQNLTRKGTNQYQFKWTCRVCGRVTEKQKAGVRINHPDTCRHNLLTSKYSGKKFHRIFCEECQTIVREVRQEDHRDVRTRVDEFNHPRPVYTNMTLDARGWRERSRMHACCDKFC